MQDAAFGIIPIFQRLSEPLVLLIQQKSGDWGFPKGHMEQAETPIVAACREFEEETGIFDYRIIGEQAFLEQYSFHQKQQSISKTVTYFLAIVQTQVVRIQQEELRDYAWLTVQDALQKLTYNTRKQLLLEAVKYYRSQD